MHPALGKGLSSDRPLWLVSLRARVHPCRTCRQTSRALAPETGGPFIAFSAMSGVRVAYHEELVILSVVEEPVLSLSKESAVPPVVTLSSDLSTRTMLALGKGLSSDRPLWFAKRHSRDHPGWVRIGRARLQPCRTRRQISRALAPEVRLATMAKAHENNSSTQKVTVSGRRIGFCERLGRS
jgi:hypothetical protein